MRLVDLNPKLEGTLSGGVLKFDCPMSHPHCFRIPVGGGTSWQASGVYPDTISIIPSIHAKIAVPINPNLRDDEYYIASQCGWHGFITNGEIVTV